MVARKRFFASSVSAPPAKSADSAVSGLNTGLTQLTRILSGPNSAGHRLRHQDHRALRAVVDREAGARAHPGGRGDVDEAPPPRLRNTGTACSAER